MKWSREKQKELSDLRDLGLTINEIADKFGTTYKSVETALRRYSVKLPKTSVNQIKNLFFPDVKEMPPVEELLNHVIAGQKLVRRFDPRQREAFPEYKTDKWIGIVIQGDWHFEHYKVDLEALVKDLDTIGAEQDVFYLFNGDAGDWSDVRFAREGYNMPSIIIPIEMRHEILWYFISKIKNLLAVTCGCHDDWVKNRHFDIIGEIKNKRNAMGLKTYYLGYGGIINFKVGKETYRIAAYHKFGRESIYNDFHPCVKFLQAIDSSCDIVAISHRHDKVGIAHQFYQHVPRIFVRSGSHQYLTDYAWKEGFSGAISYCPMVLLNGSERRMKACVNYREGIEELRRLNKE